MVQTRTMALNRQESSGGSDMAISPRMTSIPAITNAAHTEGGEITALAL